ncbi:hypothetical protein BDF19DRAFT_433148, partial [Syncephalis fuscata]
NIVLSSLILSSEGIMANDCCRSLLTIIGGTYGVILPFNDACRLDGLVNLGDCAKVFCFCGFDTYAISISIAASYLNLG